MSISVFFLVSGRLFLWSISFLYTVFSTSSASRFMQLIFIFFSKFTPRMLPNLFILSSLNVHMLYFQIISCSIHFFKLFSLLAGLFRSLQMNNFFLLDDAILIFHFYLTYMFIMLLNFNAYMAKRTRLCMEHTLNTTALLCKQQAKLAKIKMPKETGIMQF